jgi:FMN-dependent NADH-azoreductase
MPKLLHIETSPRKERSASIAAAKQFLEAYRANNPQDSIETLDVWNLNMPEFDGHAIDAKYAIMHGQDPTSEQADAWQAVVELFNRFHAADKYLLSVPMWNFGIPYKLKQFIDVITQPGLAFSFSPESGYTGLVTGRPMVVIYSRGGAYPAGSDYEAFDLQKPYVETWLRFIGFTDIRPIVIEPTLDPSKSDEARSAGLEQARKAAGGF